MFRLPLTALVLAFYFSEGRIDTRSKSHERFVLAIVIVAAWCFAPAIVFFSVGVIEDAISRLEALRTWGTSATLAVLGFYFAKKPAA